MADENKSIPDRIADLLSGLSLPVLLAIGGVIMAGVGAGGYYAYRTYDFVQHDNDFCMSCHLMADPYEQFAQSAHRGLGCKACHQPTMVARTQMALTAVIENPEEIHTHAEVPNARCAECHIEGDPEKWRHIANSVGHRVHLESDDPTLDGLQCVECHSTSVHSFAPVDRTCAQSGCHENNPIKLGGMGDLTIHCVACHAFEAPVGSEGVEVSQASLDAAILPDRQECLSCHVMRTLMEMPDPDPHGGVCASCHNPHVQSEPEQAVQTCGTGGCHEGLDTLTMFHTGLEPGVLESCLTCHKAHDFKVDGNDCQSCHVDILNDDLTMPGRSEAETATVGDLSGVVNWLHEGPALVNPWEHLTGAGIGAPPQAAARAPAQAATQERPPFLHSTHRGVACTNCHDSSDRHGGLKVTSLNDCRSCHHSAPVADSCERCHDAGDRPQGSIDHVLTMNLSVSGQHERAVAFPHARHELFGCATCHEDGPGRSAESVDCNQCHQIHHSPDNDCASCHVAAPVSAHPKNVAHVTCSASGCHATLPFEGVPRTRSTCLACHQDKRDHQEGRPCVDCHTMPAPRGEEGRL